jgi:hypothetical protein
VGFEIAEFSDRAREDFGEHAADCHRKEVLLTYTASKA